MTLKPGKVYLIGAGPGDPELITVKGLRLLRQADVILYDRLVSPELLDHARPGAEKIYVGKDPNGKCHRQEEINQLLLEKAREGKQVVRLKGGDPFLFSRGAEEMAFLVDQGIPVEPVPGVSSPIAVPECAGIPLTHREHASSFSVITGHEDPSKSLSSVRWENLATGTDTLVFLMGVKNLELIVSRLIQHGRNRETPAAVIHQGSTLKQQTVTAPLGELVEKVKKAEIQSPSIIVVGEVVRCREKLNWLENKPLFGRRIGITRSRGDSLEFGQMIRDQGGETLFLPTFRILPPESWKDLDSCLTNLSHFDWLLFTSANAVEIFLGRLNTLGMDDKDLLRLRTGAVGEKTARLARERGCPVDLVPDEYSGEGLAKALIKLDIKGKKVLIPRGDLANDDWHKTLQEAGAQVIAPLCYRNLPVETLETDTREFIREGKLDAICFTSPSSVRNFSELLEKNRVALSGRTLIASIGPTTAQAAREVLGRNDVEPGIHTLEGLAEAVIDTLKNIPR